MSILTCVLLAVLLACICVDGRQLRKERKRAEAREAELTRRIDEARMVAHKRAEELDYLIGDVRQTLQERWDAYTEQMAKLSKAVADGRDNVSEYWNYVQKLGDAAKELADKCVALEKQVAEIPTDQLQEIYDSEKQFQSGLSAIMNYGQQSYGLTKERVRND